MDLFSLKYYFYVIVGNRTAMKLLDQFIEECHHYEIDTIFGIVGIPIVTLADELIKHKIEYISFRNEQSASYAASVYGYLTGKPGVLLVVGGPGLIHSLPGMYNSISNNWPLLVISGTSFNNGMYTGDFQEMNQIALLDKYVKFTGRISKSNLNQLMFNAYNSTIQNTMGVSYIDFPGNLIEENPLVDDVPESRKYVKPKVIKTRPNEETIKEVASLIFKNRNKNILIVIGKGALNGSSIINKLIDDLQIPFLPTPMGKGIVPDFNKLNVSSARSLAIKNADIVLLFGARLNWILHFGKKPKWKQDVVFIQCDNSTTSIGFNNSVNINLTLLGDIELVVNDLYNEIRKQDSTFKYMGLTKNLIEKIATNQRKLSQLENISQYDGSNGYELNYNIVYGVLRKMMNQDRTILITEGANTMDKARISFPTEHKMTRLDAGTNATMGIGLGYSIASKMLYGNSKDVILIQGDSAFGFSGMEIETATRNRLGVIIIVMNNSGIYHGNNPHSSTKLTEKCRYDLMAIGLGANGYLIETIEDLKEKFQRALFDSRTLCKASLLNIIIDHGTQKDVSFAWQNKAKL